MNFLTLFWLAEDIQVPLNFEQVQWVQPPTFLTFVLGLCLFSVISTYSKNRFSINFSVAVPYVGNLKFYLFKAEEDF